MVPLPEWRPRRTVMDLYNERDNEPWYWRLLGSLSAALILIGFLVFPSAFDSSTNTRASQGTLSIVAVILLALGYSLSVALWFICTSLLFQLDILFIPCLFSCFLGLLNIIISLAIHNPTEKSQWTTSSISALTLALASSSIYTILSLLALRRISIVRTRDSMGRRRTDSESAHLLPEDEQQRQQLQRLLLRTDGDKTSPAASQSTFRIDLPESLKCTQESNRINTPYLTAPSNVYEGRSRSVGAIPLEENPILSRGRTQPEPYLDPKFVTLERARERSQEMRSRGYSNPRFIDHHQLQQPQQDLPIIINTRPTHLDQTDIPLSERHPLEREDYIRGLQKREPLRPEGVYRPEDHDVPPLVAEQGAMYDSSQDREERGRRRETARGELEGVKVTPRIVRVQTDGWPVDDR